MVSGDRSKCKHPERLCKWCFECDNDIKDNEVKEITLKELEVAALNVKAPLLRATERIILAALVLKKNGGLQLDHQASMLLKRAYASEDVRTGLEF